MNDSYSENVIEARGHDTEYMPRTEKKSVINPAETYTDAQWEKLAPDLRSELETQYILSLPGLKPRLGKAKKIQTRPSIFTQAELEYLYSYPSLVEQIKQLIEVHKQNA
jgi:hypothetical protein